MSTHDWKKLKQIWLSGKYVTMSQMCKKMKIPKSTFFKRVAREKWTDKKKAVDDKVEEIVAEKTAQLRASRHIEIVEKQLKVAQVILGLSLNAFAGKKKISKESDAIAGVRLAVDMQLKALRELREQDGDGNSSAHSQAPDVNVQVNVANVGANNLQDWSNEMIQHRLMEIAKEKKHLQESDGK